MMMKSATPVHQNNNNNYNNQQQGFTGGRHSSAMKMSSSSSSGGALFVPAKLFDPQQQQQQTNNNNSENTNNNQLTLSQNKEDPQHQKIGIDYFQAGLKLTTHHLLGKGGFAHVYAARSPSNESYALKVCKEMNENNWRRLQDEVRILQMFEGHQNIVRLYAAARIESQAYLAMERCVSSSLHDILNHRALNLPEILWIGHQLLTTLRFIHDKNCIHRDLKPQNILFDYEGNVKVIDFGLSSRIGDSDVTRKTVAGTAVYMAPEMAKYYIRWKERKELKEQQQQQQENNNNNGDAAAAAAAAAAGGSLEDLPPLQYGKEIDVWSFGVVMFVMMTRSSPYWNTYRTGRDAKARQREIFNAVSNANWQWPAEFSGDAELMDLIEQLLYRERGQRPSLEDMMSHPVWKRRPYSCPLTLLRALRLVDDENSSSSCSSSSQKMKQQQQQNPTSAASGASPLQQSGRTNVLQSNNNNNNINSAAAASSSSSGGNQQQQQQQYTPNAYASSHRYRLPESDIIRKGAEKIEQAEALERIALVNERGASLSELDEFYTLGTQELNHRRMIINQESMERQTLWHISRHLEKGSNFIAVDSAFNIPVSPDGAINLLDTSSSSSSSSNNNNHHHRRSSSTAAAIAFMGHQDNNNNQQQQQQNQNQNQNQFSSNNNSNYNREVSVQLPDAQQKPLMSDFRRQRGASVMLVPDAASSSSNNNYQNINQNDNNSAGNFGSGRRSVSANLNSNNNNNSNSRQRAQSVIPCAIPKCVNGHETIVQAKLPFQQDGWWYEALECNACKEQFRVLSNSKCMFRCTKCDYDICHKCAESNRPVDAQHACMKCSKLFVTETKMRNHFRSCRGPSMSPSPARASDARNTAIWEGAMASNNQQQQQQNQTRSTSGRKSSASVSFREPNNNAGVGDHFATPENNYYRGGGGGGGASTGGRLSLGALSSGGRISVGNTIEPPPTFDEISVTNNNNNNNNRRIKSVSLLNQKHQQQQDDNDENEYDNNQKSRRGNTNNNRLSNVPIPGQLVQPRARQPYTREMVELDEPENEKFENQNQNNNNHNNSKNPNKFHRFEEEGQEEGGTNNNNNNNNNKSTRIGQNSSYDRKGSAASTSQQRVHVDITSTAAVKPAEVNKPPTLTGTSRANSKTRSRASSLAELAALQHTSHLAVDHLNPNSAFLNPTSNNNNSNNRGGSRSATPQPMMMNDNNNNTKQNRRGGASSSVHAPSPHRHGPAQNQTTQRNTSKTREASKPAASLHQPRQPPRSSLGAAVGGGQQLQQNQNQQQNQQQQQQQQGGGGGAFLALPRRDDQRANFLEEFLRGSWVRHYAFATNDVAILYYCLQPGRFGALYQNSGSMATIVVDIHSRLVLVVPSLRGDSAHHHNNQNNNNMMMTRRNNNNQQQRDIHVDSEYEEEARVMPLREAQNIAGPVIGGILDYVNEITRMRAEGHVPVYVPAAFVHRSGDHSVPADTKFSYLRRVFPDPGSSFTLFRLSNLRSQIICTTTHQLDIRWQSDRRNHVGMKYYVYGDGRAEPFAVDTTGILSRVERVLTDAFSNSGR